MVSFVDFQLPTTETLVVVGFLFVLFAALMMVAYPLILKNNSSMGKLSTRLLSLLSSSWPWSSCLYSIKVGRQSGTHTSPVALIKHLPGAN